MSPGRSVVHFSLEASIERVRVASEYHCTIVMYIVFDGNGYPVARRALNGVILIKIG